MSIITTRYRDVPREELEHPISKASNWDDYRGKEVQVMTPPGPDGMVLRFKGLCDGPFYLKPGGGAVCPHIAEIGD